MAVFCTHAIADPLVSTLMLDYLVRLQNEGPVQDVLLFTEEGPGTQADGSTKEGLLEKRIDWIPLHYDVKGAQWTQKLVIAWQVWRKTRSFMRGRDQRWLVGFLSFGGAYAALLGRMALGRSATICFEPHSRYMVELGTWGDRSLKARVMHILERLQMRRSDLLVVPTKAGVDLAMEHHPKGRVVLQAITINVNEALFDPVGRERYRAQYVMEGSTLLAYVGKFGGIYYSAGAYLRFVERALQADRSLRFLIIASHRDLDAIRSVPSFKGLEQHLILHPPVPPSELGALLSAADLGVMAIPPTPSQVFRTPVKTAHYWSAGLPLIIPEGISDDWRIARMEGLGIVTGDLPELDIVHFRSELDAWRRRNVEEVRRACISAARRYRDTEAMVRLLQREFADETLPTKADR